MKMMELPSADDARGLSTLLDVARSVRSTLDLAPLLTLILDQLRVVADYAGAAVMVLEGDKAQFLEARGASAADSPIPPVINSIATWSEQHAPPRTPRCSDRRVCFTGPG